MICTRAFKLLKRKTVTNLFLKNGFHIHQSCSLFYSRFSTDPTRYEYIVYYCRDFIRHLHGCKCAKTNANIICTICMHTLPFGKTLQKFNFQHKVGLCGWGRHLNISVIGPHMRHQRRGKRSFF